MGGTVVGVNAADVIASLQAKFSGLTPKASWGETSLFFNPGGVLPSGVYFCTVKDHDGANDKASQLDRPGVFRVALGLPRNRYEELFGPRPPRPPKGGVVMTGHDFTVTNVVMPHPVYAWMGWVQVLSPSADTFAEMHPLFTASYDAVLAKFEAQRAKRSRPRN
jgi:hypothetical protein